MSDLKAKERLIVALDVPTAKEAMNLVEKLDDDVLFYKIGWQLFMTGDLQWLLKALLEKRVFVDLKVPGDIGNTIRSVVELCIRMQVRFLTLSDFVPAATIQSAQAAKEGEYPKLLVVPFLSSLDCEDLGRFQDDQEPDLDAYIKERANLAISAGCDGLIASGRAIGLLKTAHPDALIVSPGIRPTGSSTDDHKRFTTPAEAIQLGADYLVVGRPIRSAPDPRDHARRIVDEIHGALEARRRASAGESSSDFPHSMCASPPTN